jgi:hypothetical protein
MSNGQIFISYRREDSAGYTRAIYDRLVRHFAEERVFMDVDAIEPGLPFDEAINRALEQCEVLLVVIGRRWLDAQSGPGPRINDPQDFVRREIAAALSRNIRVIPVLIDGAGMPGEESLPEPLRALSRRNALEISNSRFASDTEILIQAVRKALGEGGEPGSLAIPGRRRSVLYWLAGGLAMGLIAAVAYLYFQPEHHGSAVQPPPAQNTSRELAQDMRPGVNGDWQADVTYDWPNARYVEKFNFRGTGDEVYGTASFLGGKKQILEGTIKKDGLRFITRTQEVLGGDSQNAKDVVHRYRGELLDNEIRFIMQTEGGYSEHIPIEFTAKKVLVP